MAEDTAYAARMRKEAAADEAFVVILEGLKAFFDGRATLHVGGNPVRFVKDKDARPPKS